MAFRVAVAGAAGAAGREVLRSLGERGFPVREAAALGTGRAVGQPVSFGDRASLTVRPLESFDFAGWDLAFFCAGAAASLAHAPRAARAGCAVVDDSPAFRLEPGVPLLVPEVNPQALKSFRRRVLALPDAAAVALALALAPLHARARARQVVAVALHPVSGAGKEGMDELFNQTKASFVNDAPVQEHFPKPIAFNAIPQVGAFAEDGATAAEGALQAEMRKLLDPDIQVGATAVRVPVFVGLGLAVHAAFEQPLTPREAQALLRDAPGLQLVDRREEGGYATPLDAAGEDAAMVGRVRRDPALPNGLAFWVAMDNLRTGAALNAVQCAELLAKEGLIGGG